MKQLLLLSYFLILVAALPSATPKPGCETKSPGFPPWSGGPSSILKRGVRDPWHYYVDFEIGYPPQNVSLVLDTGSSDIWISGPEVCHNCTFETCRKPTQSAVLFPANSRRQCFYLRLK
jgi:hypothetical protein